MSFQDPLQRQSTYDGQEIKADNTGSQSAEEDASGKSKKTPKHRRNYQACEPCRERKVKCDLGDVDNPRNGPCAKCARESKSCWFRETRKKDSLKDGGRPAKRQRTDSANSARTFQGLAESPQHSLSSVTRQSIPLSPVRQFPPSTPPAPSPVRNMNGFPQPRSTPGQYSQPTSASMPRLNLDYPAAYDRTSNGEDHVVMPEASRLNRNFTNTMDGLDTLLHATKSVENKANAQKALNRSRMRSGNVNDPDLKTLPDQFAQSRNEARELWNQMRFVRAGWLTADEALEYIEYFYSHLAPMTPVISQYFRDPATHRELLVEEPVLALAILAITSRYYQLKGPGAVSRNYHIHSDLWDSLRKIVQRLLWGQEQFGGGFTGAGNVSTQQTSTGQLTWKGSLRTLGTIEALLLLTDWQPRALHFPPGNDENKLIGAGFALIEEERPKAADNGGLPYATWLEPAWRSDRMSWMLLGLAQSLSFELGVFDTRHEHCGRDHGPNSECAKKRRLRRLMITYVCQISGRIGIQTSLVPQQDDDPNGPELLSHTDTVERLWFDIASIMFEANRDLFPSRDMTARLIDSGEYKISIRHFQPKLQKWMRDYERIQRDMHPAMKVVLSMEYHYSRLYINSLGLQKVVGQMALQDRKTINRGLPTQLGSVFEENKSYIDEVRNAADSILRLSCHGLGDLKALGYSPVRTFLRTLSALMFSLKLFSLGNEERIVRATFKLLREMTKRMGEQVVDDVHLMPHTAELIQKLMEDVHSSMVRITKPGSRGQSRQLSPQIPGQPGQNGANITYSTISDQESPDPLAQLPFADWTNHIYMPPPGYEGFGIDSGGYDMNVDPALFPNGDDWISMPIDNLLNLDASTVNQGYGGIGPTVGDRDMLSLITGSHLDQNQGLGSGLPNFIGMGNGF